MSITNHTQTLSHLVSSILVIRSLLALVCFYFSFWGKSVWLFAFSDLFWRFVCAYLFSSFLVRRDQVTYSISVRIFNQITATTSAPKTPHRSAFISDLGYLSILFLYVLSILGLELYLLLASMIFFSFCFRVSIFIDLTSFLSLVLLFFLVEDLLSKNMFHFGITAAIRKSTSTLVKETKTTITRSRSSTSSSTTTIVTKTPKPIQTDSTQSRRLKTDSNELCYIRNCYCYLDLDRYCYFENISCYLIVHDLENIGLVLIQSLLYAVT